MRSVLGIILGFFITCSASSALNYVDTALLAGSKNYVKNGGAEQGRAGWTTYADAAGTTPVDCTGGSPVSTWTPSATTPLSGQYSFVWNHGAANRQGEGAAYAFTIDKSDQARQMSVSFDYEVATGTFAVGVVPIGGATAADSDLEVYVYDVTNATVIQPSNFRLLGGSGSQQRFTGTFQTASNSQSYRLCLHAATTTTTAHTLRIDSVKVGPVLAPTAPIVGDTGAVAWTPTGSWSANTTYTGWWRRDGDMGEYWVKISLAGAPTSATLTINLPSGHAYDTSKMPNDASFTPLGDGALSHSGVGHKLYVVQGSGNTALIAFQSAASSTSSAGSVVTQAAPVTFASGDTLDFHFKAPMLGWSSGNPSAQAGDDTRIVGAAYVQDTSSSNTSVAPAGTAIIDFNTKTRDDAGLATTGSSWKFTASSPGWYQVNASAKFTGATAFTAGDQMNLYLYKTGVKGPLMGIFISYGSNSGHSGISGSALTYLNAGDYVDVRLNNNATPTVNFDKEGAISVMKQGGAAQLTAADTVGAKAYGSATSVTSGGTVVLVFGTKEYDYTGGSYDTSTGIFTAPIPGLYEACSYFEASGATGTGAINNAETLRLQKNGSDLAFVGTFVAQQTGTALTRKLHGCGKARLVAGDTLKFAINNPDSTFTGANNQSQTWASFTRVGN
jgi:hypothetical protein